MVGATVVVAGNDAAVLMGRGEDLYCGGGEAVMGIPGLGDGVPEPP